MVDSGLKPPPDGKELLDGGSQRPQDGSFVPDGAGLPDSLTPPMLRDASLPKPGPKPMSGGDGR